MSSLCGNSGILIVVVVLVEVSVSTVYCILGIVRGKFVSVDGLVLSTVLRALIYDEIGDRRLPASIHINEPGMSFLPSDRRSSTASTTFFFSKEKDRIAARPIRYSKVSKYQTN